MKTDIFHTTLKISSFIFNLLQTRHPPSCQPRQPTPGHRRLHDDPCGLPPGEKGSEPARGFRGAAGIALLILSLRAGKVALTNPVNSLRSE